MSEPVPVFRFIMKSKNVNLFGKIKIALWNFILPPHIRLELTEHNKENCI